VVRAVVRGWRAPPSPAWLRAALGAASRAAFGAPEATVGAGDAIAAARLLADALPDTPLVVTGVPDDARPAEDAGERLAVALAHVLGAAAEARQ
jgi:hypothetical protein